ncbi:MAG: phospholipid carrier-dependent glycosyltransferase [Bacteroidales bacterium]
MKNLIFQQIKKHKDASIFTALAALVFLFLSISAPKMGVLGDEVIDADNGKYALKYFLEGDTTFANFPMAQGNILDIPLTQKYYGVGFEIIPAVLVRCEALKKYEILFRRLLCALFAFLTALFTALLAKELKNWKLASFTIFFFFISPCFFGLSLIAVKDIPTAAGFAIAIYGIVRFLNHLPDYKWSALIWASIGTALALSIRINGLMLIFYFGVAAIMSLLMKKKIQQLAFTKPYTFLWKTSLWIILSCIIGVAIGLCFYPNTFYVGPIQHIMDAFRVVSKFPARINMLFDGKEITSTNLPANYLLINLWVSLPFIVGLGIALAIINVRRIWKHYDKTAIFFIFFALIFPIFYVIISKANIYNGWRHLTFIYPLIALIQAIGIYETYRWFSTSKFYPSWRILFTLVLIGSCLPTVLWMKDNFLYSYSFYNKLAKKPHGNYDLEYSETALIHEFEWLVKNELKDKKDTTIITSKSANVLYYQAVKQYPNIITAIVPVKFFTDIRCDYSILHINFLPPKVLNSFFPPKGTIHTQKMYGKPVSAIVKRKKEEFDAIELMQQNKIYEGEALLRKLYAENPNNFGLWFWMGYLNFSKKNYDAAIEFYSKYIGFWPQTDYIDWIVFHVGVIRIEEAKYDETIRISKDHFLKCKNQDIRPFIQGNLAIAYFHKEEYAKTLEYLTPVIERFPHLKPMLELSSQKLKTR